MSRYAIHSCDRQTGTVLITVLIVLCVAMMLVISAGQNTVVDNKMQANIEQYNAVFNRAEAGLMQIILGFEGQSIVLPDSTIALKATHHIVSVDACGNQTIDFQSTAQNALSTVVLNSRDIFARVPREKGCGVIPVHQVVWWRE